MRSFRNALYLLIVIISVLILQNCGATDPAPEKAGFFNEDYLLSASWQQSSVPVNLVEPLGLIDSELMETKGNVYWYNLSPSDVVIAEIIDTVSSDLVKTLKISFDPETRGCYNYNIDYQRSKNSWGGTMTLLKTGDFKSLNNSIESTVLSIWLTSNGGHYFYLDLGQVSEEVIPNRELDTEDLNQNELLNENEDRGIDFLYDDAEDNYNERNNIDPNNDDYYFDRHTLNYEKVNYPEGNGVLNSEDINYNFTLDYADNYYTYKIPLGAENNKYLVYKDDDRDWYKIEIPLSDYFSKIGTPEESEISTIRIWFDNDSDKMDLEIAEMKFVNK